MITQLGDVPDTIVVLNCSANASDCSFRTASHTSLNVIKPITKLTCAFVCLLGLQLLSTAHAALNVRNGNNSIAYRDLRTQPAGSLELARSYNSFSGEAGWLGVGWGTLFETRLVTFADGTAAIREYGSGAFTYYGAADAVAKDKAATGDMFSRALQNNSADAKARDKAAADLGQIIANREKLDAAATSRLIGDMARNRDLMVQKSIQHQLPLHEIRHELPTSSCASGRLVSDDQGYVRIGCDYSRERFSKQGVLLSRSPMPGDEITAMYNGGKRPSEIRHSSGDKITLTWDASGRLLSASNPRGQRMSYEYDSRGDLVRTSGAGPEPAYQYSYDDKHNLLQIKYIDGTELLYAYDPKGRLSKVTERTGERLDISYPITLDKPQLDSTRVARFDFQGNLVNERRMAWERGSDLLLEFSVNRELYWNFGYDAGRLINAHHKDKDQVDDSVRLSYDNKGRVKEAELSSPKFKSTTLQFAYNDSSQVTKLVLPGNRDARLVWDNNEAYSVESAQGQSVVEEVTELLLRLRNFVAPTGISLGI